jgi:predicted ATPase
MLLRSLDLAKRQDAGAWELRTATSLARFYLRLGRRGEGSAVLTPVLEQLKQGRDTRDIQGAINLLRSLADDYFSLREEAPSLWRVRRVNLWSRHGPA